MEGTARALREAASRVVVACSGGADSSLLALLAAEAGVDFRLVHVDHRLHSESRRGAESVRALGARVGAEVAVLELDGAALRADPAGVEAAARRARYLALAAELRDGEVIATAHTATDRLTTALMRLAQGAGLAALAGPSPSLELAGATVVRPLLAWWRDEVERELEHRACLPYRDPANASPEHLRNRIEPIAAQLLARADAEVLERSIARVASDAALFEALVMAACDAVTLLASPRERWFDRAALAALDPALRAAVIAAAWRRLPTPRPDSRAIDRAAAAATDGATVQARGLRVECGRTWMRIAAVANSRASLEPPPFGAASVRAGRRIEVAPFGALEARPWLGRHPSPSADETVVDLDAVVGALVLRRATDADWIEVPRGRRPLPKVLRSDGVGAPDRRIAMVVADDEGVLWVCGARRAERAGVGERTTRALALRWTGPAAPRPPSP